MPGKGASRRSGARHPWSSRTIGIVRLACGSFPANAPAVPLSARAVNPDNLRLLAVAERIDKLHAICVVCGEDATRNQRLIDGVPAPAEGPTIQVGGTEQYEARCRRCHEVPLVDRGQGELLG